MHSKSSNFRSLEIQSKGTALFYWNS